MRKSLAGIAVLIALCSTTAALAAVHGNRQPNIKLGGSWSGTYSGSYSGKFTLTWTQAASGVLTGSIKLSKPQGTYGITGKVTGSAIHFGVVGAGAKYTGSATTLKMSGNYVAGGGGSGTWTAHKLLTPVKIKLP